jgi:hypothetical protein
MIPRLKVKFRKRNGVPYAIEQFTGKQYRCRCCNAVFYEMEEIVRHIHDAHAKGNHAVAKSAPRLSTNVVEKLYYTYDINDKLKSKYLRLDNAEEYDGI